MKRLLAKAFCVLLIAAAYVAAPFWTAFSIREAVKTGDTAYLDAKIDWANVRETMRRSLHQHALDLPDSAVLESQAIPASQGLWQRVKSYAGRSVIDGFVDRYVNADGFAQLHRFRRLYREKIKGETDDVASLPRLERMRRVWARIVRAEFHSFTEFEIEQRDRFDASRSYVGLLKLRGLEWTLTELRVRSSNTIGSIASAR